MDISNELKEDITKMKNCAEELGITFQEYLSYKTYKQLQKLEGLVDNIEYHSEEIRKKI